MKEVSIIIPTYNEAENIKRLLGRLEQQKVENFEVIVADAGSDDGTAEIAGEWGAKVVEGGVPGVGRNKGAAVATADLLVFMDADIDFDDGFLTSALDEFDSRKLDFAIGYFETAHPKLRYRLLFRYSNLWKRLMEKTKFPDGTGQFIVARKEKFQALGGFADYPIAEDTLLFRKAAKRGMKTGVLNVRFYSSTRRFDRKGVIYIYTFWLFLGIFMVTGLFNLKRVQKFLTRLYGGMGNV